MVLCFSLAAACIIATIVLAVVFGVKWGSSSAFSMQSHNDTQTLAATNSVTNAAPSAPRRVRELHRALHVVVARFNEDMAWLLRDLPQMCAGFTSCAVYLYEKGPLHVSPEWHDAARRAGASTSRSIALPNVGRDFHTYLHYIVEHYGPKLPAVAVFLPGSARSIERKGPMTDAVLQSLPASEAASSDVYDLAFFDGFAIDTYASSDAANLQFNPETNLQPASPRPMGPWRLEHVGKGMETEGPVGWCGISSATWAAIMARPRELYQRLLATVNTSSSPEATHYLERLWGTLVRPGPVPHVVWLLWLQGWDSAPEFALAVASTWRHHNPAWHIQLVDARNVHDFAEVTIPEGASPAAKSDIIRLALLEQQGGLWADASMMCLRPIDSWLQHAVPLAGHGVWMYHGRDDARGPASWFIVARPATYIITRWAAAARKYWQDRADTDNYFWMDELFGNLARTDARFRSQWHAVPFLDCNAAGSSHVGPEAVLSHTTAPFAVKLFADKRNVDGATARLLTQSLAGRFAYPAGRGEEEGMHIKPESFFEGAQYYP